MHIDFARRRARGGRGLIPPNPSQWEHEHQALDVREDLGLPPDQALPPIEVVYNLLPGVTITPHGELPVAEVYAEYFRKDGRERWSGLAVPMPDETVLVIYNDAHASARIRVTLMEEFFHIRLAHPPTVLRMLRDSEGPNRTYNSDVESQAYGCGAAALLPYAGLKKMLDAGEAVRGIAAYYVVSPALVLFRLKVTKLYRKTARWRR